MSHFLSKASMKYLAGTLFIALFFFSGCSQKEPLPVFVETKIEKDDSKKRSEIVQQALKHLHKKDGGDCSGFVNLVNKETQEPFFEAKALQEYYEDARRSLAIYNLLEAEQRLHWEDKPKLGDLIFFANTVKKYAKSNISDNITHIGIVTKIEADGTVQFIHHTKGKNMIGYLNTNYPDTAVNNGKILNSYMEKCPPKEGFKCLAPRYFSAYGVIR